MSSSCCRCSQSAHSKRISVGLTVACQRSLFLFLQMRKLRPGHVVGFTEGHPAEQHQSWDWSQVGPHSPSLGNLCLQSGSGISLLLCVLCGVSESGTDPRGLSVFQLSLFMSTLMGLCRLVQLSGVSQRATWSCVCPRMFTVRGAETKQHPSC